MRVSVCAFGLCEGSCKPVGLAPIGILVATLQESCHKGQQLLLAFSMIGPRDAAFEVAVSSFVPERATRENAGNRRTLWKKLALMIMQKHTVA